MLPAGAVVYARRRRRRRSITDDSVDTLFGEATFDIMDLGEGDDDMIDQHQNDDAFEDLCDRLFNADEESQAGEFWNPERVERIRPVDSNASEDWAAPTLPRTAPPLHRPAATSTTLARLPQATATRSEPSTSPVSESVGKPSSPNRVRRWLFGSLGLLFWGVLLAFCLVKGFTPHVTTKPIDQFQVGMVVPGDKIRGDNDLTYGDKVDPETWRHLLVEGTKADGSRWDADLLMPPEWLEEQQARVGGDVYVSVPECGIDGMARVRSLGPCPKIHDLDGRVVTAVLRHHSAHVLDLHIDGLDEPIGVTANHPFWSEDRKEFVRADSLKLGERLRKLDGGTQQVVSSNTRPGTRSVYNLQVNVDHVFHVGSSGLLVHNSTNGPCPIKFTLGSWMARTVTGMGQFGRGLPSFKSNFLTKLSGRAVSRLLGRKISKISALQRQYPNAGIANLTKNNKAQMEALIQDLALKRVLRGGGTTGPFLNNTQQARFFDDGYVTWIFDLNGTFHSLRIN